MLAVALLSGTGGRLKVSAAEGWDGQSYDISWYIEAGGDQATSFEISTPEELNGLSLLTEWAVLSEKRSSSDPTYRKICYDENNRLIVDTDADKTLTDEVGYSAGRTFTEGGNRFQGRTFTLKKDIDLNGKAWRPIGMSGGFNGILDGGGHTVSHFVINNESVTPNPVGGTSANRYYSFILTTSGNNAQITGLTLADATFVVDSDIDNLYIGVFVGKVFGTQTLEDCAIRNVTIQVKKIGNKVTSFGYAIAEFSPNSLSQPLTMKNIEASGLKVEKGSLDLGTPVRDGWIAVEKAGSQVIAENLTVKATADSSGSGSGSSSGSESAGGSGATSGSGSTSGSSSAGGNAPSTGDVLPAAVTALLFAGFTAFGIGKLRKKKD